MKNTPEVLKNCIVPQVSQRMNPEKIVSDPDRHVRNAIDFGKDDYRSIILRNMGKEPNGTQNRE